MTKHRPAFFPFVFVVHKHPQRCICKECGEPIQYECSQEDAHTAIRIFFCFFSFFFYNLIDGFFFEEMVEIVRLMSNGKVAFFVALLLDCINGYFCFYVLNRVVDYFFFSFEIAEAEEDAAVKR